MDTTRTGFVQQQVAGGLRDGLDGLAVHFQLVGAGRDLEARRATGSPLTLTRPAAMSSSARRREQTPASASALLIRTVFSMILLGARARGRFRPGFSAGACR